MATLERRPSGIYYLRWYSAWKDPKVIRESLKTKEKKRAEGLKVQLEYKFLDGKHDPWLRKWYEHQLLTNNPRLSQAADMYVTSKTTAQAWNENTCKQVKSLLNRLCMHGSDPYVSQLDIQYLRSFYDRPGDRSAHTTAFEQRNIRAFCRYLFQEGYIKQMVDAPVKRPQASLPEFLTASMLDQVYQAKQGFIDLAEKYTKTGNSSWHIDVWKWAASTGMRKSEICSLRIDAIREATIVVGYGHRTKSGKQRAVPILFEAPQILQKYTDPSYRQADPVLDRSPMLFGRSKQGIDRMAREFSRICRQEFPGRPELSFHSLRHTFAIRYLTAPGSPGDYRLVKLQQVLGHADISTTMKYLKIDPAQLGL